MPKDEVAAEEKGDPGDVEERRSPVVVLANSVDHGPRTQRQGDHDEGDLRFRTGQELETYDRQQSEGNASEEAMNRACRTGKDAPPIKIPLGLHLSRIPLGGSRLRKACGGKGSGNVDHTDR